jgi:hypothetical protein
MRLSLLLPALAALGSSASAADLSKVERRLVKEPAYQSPAPKYCLLVFGPEAKTRLWVVIDGDTLYADRNGSGDLTEAGKKVPRSGGGAWQVFDLGTVPDPDGKGRQVRLQLRTFGDQHTRLIVRLDGKRQQFVGWDDADPFRFGDRPQDAPVIHLDGPLQIRWYGEAPSFLAGQASEIDVAIGTPGVSKGSFASIQCCEVLNCKVSPAVEVEFPPIDPKERPIRIRHLIGDD